METDSSAAKGVVSRAGRGKVKHLETSLLWVQERASRGEIVHRKIPREINGADLLTHHCSRRELDRHFLRMHVELRQKKTLVSD